MIKVVLDANVFISGLLSQSGPPHEILNFWLAGRINIFISPQIKEELVRVIYYPRIYERLSNTQITRFFVLLERLSTKTKGDLKLQILTQDPEDNIYLACAVEAQAEYLVTGNLNHFLEAGEKYQWIKFVSPREFLDKLIKGK